MSVELLLSAASYATTTVTVVCLVMLALGLPLSLALACAIYRASRRARPTDLPVLLDGLIGALRAARGAGEQDAHSAMCITEGPRKRRRYTVSAHRSR
jgi:hypothetical protein